MGYTDNRVKLNFKERLKATCPEHMPLSDAPSYEELTAHCKTDSEEREAIATESKRRYSATNGVFVYLMRNEPAISQYQVKYGATTVTRAYPRQHCTLMTEEELRKKGKNTRQSKSDWE